MTRPARKQTFRPDSRFFREALRMRAAGLEPALALLMIASLTIQVSRQSVADEPLSSPNSRQVIAEIARDLQADDALAAQTKLIVFDDAVIQQRLSDVDTTMPLVQVARALEQAGKPAADCYRRALKAAKRSAAAGLSPKQLSLIRMAAGSHLARNGHRSEAIDAFADTLDESDSITPVQRQNVGQLLMLLGSDALASQDAKTAERAYAMAVQHASTELRPTHSLGLAWAIAMQDDRQADAAKALTKFVESYPNHSDVTRAAALCIRCFRRAKQTEQAEAMTSRLLARWPTSDAAKSLMKSYCDDCLTSKTAIAELPQSARTWLMGRSTPERIGTLDPSSVVVALLVAVDDQQTSMVDRLASHLAAKDESGRLIARVLKSLTDANQSDTAQRITATLIAPIKNDEAISPTKESLKTQNASPTAGARESACRWAGRQQLWTMLAFASESSQPSVAEPTRTAAVERLYAESLMQVGQPANAKIWWDHLVDKRNADDFITLLRCAETATSFDEISVAKKRIESASIAAGDDANQRSLIAMLAAELSVRELKFDDARDTLAEVADSDQAIAILRSRAQWTIGETYYMQQKFADAIEAYRKVEGIDPEGDWIAVSLVQAGKSFEQLGRKKEAAVCYSTLISRFGESQHAIAARQRLAAIAPESATSNDTIRR